MMNEYQSSVYQTLHSSEGSSEMLEEASEALTNYLDKVLQPISGALRYLKKLGV